MKREISILFVLLFLFTNVFYANDSTLMKDYYVSDNLFASKKPKPHIPRGGRTQIPRGIEGKHVNIGFNVGGTFAFIDALKTEKAFIGGRASIFAHAIIPKTKTLAIGIEGGLTYLLANADKYKETFVAATRDGSSASEKMPEVSVSNWMLPTGQVSFLGNFHPVERINIQIKGNIGVVLAMIPKYETKYYIREAELDGSYIDREYHFVYGNQMKIGLSATVGTKLLFAVAPHTEFGVGLDFSYMRFSYDKAWISPKIKSVTELTQFGMLDLHVGFAFSF